MFFLVTSIVFFYSGSLVAAPAPATSSSRLAHAEFGFFQNRYSLTLHLADSPWFIDEDSGKDSYRLHHREIKSTSLTAQLRLLQREEAIEDLKKQAGQQLPSLGLQVLGARGLVNKSNQAPYGLVFDTQMNRLGRSQRMFVFQIPEAGAWVLTCTTELAQFSSLVSHCNQLGARLQAAIDSLPFPKTEKKSR